jgi:flagella synthesis protein FlgN
LTDIASDHPSAELTTHLKNESSALRAFIVLLEKEQQALLLPDSDLLLTLAEEKTQVTHKLAELSSLRRRNLNLNTVNLDTTAWIEKNAPDCLAAWKEVRELATRAHQLNQTNGEVIQLKLRSNQKALTVLLGASESVAGLYGRDGQTNLPIAGRTLGSV